MIILFNFLNNRFYFKYIKHIEFKKFLTLPNNILNYKPNSNKHPIWLRLS